MRTVFPKKAFIALIAGFALGAGLIVLALFPVHQSTSTWKGFRVLAVSDFPPEKEIMGRLEKAGIRDIVSETNSVIPSGDPQTPVIPFLAEVNANRARWFSDREGKSRLVYLEDKPFLDAGVKKAFEGSNYGWILEQSGTFNGIPVICVYILMVVGVLTAKRKGFLLACGIPFGILSFACNDRTGFLAAILSIVVLLLVEDSFFTGQIGTFRRRFPAIVRARPVHTLSLAIPFIISGTGGLQHTILLIAALISAIAAGILFTLAADRIRIVRDSRRLHPAFRPVRMVQSPRGLNIDRKHLIILASVCVAAIAAGTLSLTLHKTLPSAVNPAQELYIPAPTGYTPHSGFTVEGFRDLGSIKTEHDLPDLSDFIATRWNIRVYPWKKIRSPVVRPEPGDTLDEIRYSADDSGKITEERKTLDTFDSGFIREKLSEDSTPLERLLMRQGKFVSVTFKRLM